jgi:hypothetical protein
MRSSSDRPARGITLDIYALEWCDTPPGGAKERMNTIALAILVTVLLLRHRQSARPDDPTVAGCSVTESVDTALPDLGRRTTSSGNDSSRPRQSRCCAAASGAFLMALYIRPHSWSRS